MPIYQIELEIVWFLFMFFICFAIAKHTQSISNLSSRPTGDF